jgi:hypothetical protein
MFAAHSEEIERLAGEGAVGACWAQWVSLGSPASSLGGWHASAIVDPEVLILLSICVQERERRLLDMVRWWARVGSRLTSVQRFQSVAENFPADGRQAALRTFGSLALAAGDRRWSRHARGGEVTSSRRDRGPDAPSLDDAPTLWLRLRAGFGVGAKADTLAFLLGTPDAWSSTKSIAFATGYSSVATRSAASEMAMARFVRESSRRPVEYSASAEVWAPVLSLSGPDQMPPWRFWSEIFAFLAGAIGWVRLANASDAPGPHVLASRARDLTEKHQRAFDLNGITVPRPGSHRGIEAVEGLLDAVSVVASWVEAHV